MSAHPETKQYPVSHSEAEWRKILTPEQYHIMREHGTERPGSCALNYEKRAGTFYCAGCDQKLFVSKTKFESGTGWPSFNDPEPGAVESSTDRSYGMVRNEVHCSRCGSHLGHVFEDGPPPTHLRYCINGVAMNFKPQSGVSAIGGSMRIVDLSRELYHRTPSYPGQPPIIHGVWKTHEESFVESGNVQGNMVMFFSMPDHGGTHIDAPRHFGKSGTPIDKYPLENCIVRGICMDLRHIAPRAEITPTDLEAAVKTAGVAIPKKGTVLLCTGHHARTFPTPAYSTDNPGVNVAATEWLARQGIVHFGIDSMRPGPEGKINALVHKACLELDITHMESLCNLEALLGQGEFQFIGLPLKWREGTGSPIRAVAVFDD